MLLGITESNFLPHTNLNLLTAMDYLYKFEVMERVSRPTSDEIKLRISVLIGGTFLVEVSQDRWIHRKNSNCFSPVDRTRNLARLICGDEWFLQDILFDLFEGNMESATIEDAHTRKNNDEQY